MRNLMLGLMFVTILTLASPAATSMRQRSQPPVHVYAGGIWEDLEGVASWYGATDPGVVPWTASAEPFDDQALTCAIWGIPFHTFLKVTNLNNGQSVIVRVNDRGPAERLVLAEDRVIDLTYAAFHAIADTAAGLIPVRVELEEAPISSQE